MKTVFKVGMEVYDQFYFPNKKGKVISILEESDFPVFVEIEGDCKMFQYTLDGRFFNHIIKTLSTRPYKIETQGFEQKAPAPTFEEAWNYTKKVYVSKIENFEKYKGYTSKEISDAFEALRKLIFLRDYYNEGWQPNWKNIDLKYIIENYRGKIGTVQSCDSYNILAFKSEEIRYNFLVEQRELLEIAKPLL